MKKEAKRPGIDPEKITLVEVLVLRSSIDSSEGYLRAPSKPDRMLLDLGTESGHDLSNNKFRFRLQMNLDAQSETGDSLGVSAAFLMDFLFRVENLLDYKLEGDGPARFDPMLGATLLGISFSTARGIVLERTKGSPLANFILPVINPAKALFESKGIEPGKDGQL